MNEELIQILEKVSSLYQKYGIKSVTMDDVASELGISKKTLYQHVSDKADLVERAVFFDQKRRQEFFTAIENRNLNAIEQLLVVNKAVFKVLQSLNPSAEYDLKKYYPQIHKRIREKTREHMHESILRNMVKGKKEGLYRKNLNAEVITKLTLFRNETIVQCDVFTTDEMTSPEVFNEIFYYHIRGMASDKGIKLLEKLIGKNIGE